MGEFVGEQFEDYGNAMECVVTKLGGYETLAGGLVRLFLCKQFHGRLMLDHTSIMTRGEMRALAHKLLEIADAPSITADWASHGEFSKMAS